MVILDKNLNPLFNVLRELGLDWLEDELKSGILYGNEPALSRQTLAQEWELINSGRSGRFVNLEDFHHPGDQQSNDNQLKWATQTLINRLKDKIEETSTSLDAIEEIVLNTQIETEPTSVITNDSVKKVQIRLSEEEVDHEIELERLSEARMQVEKLEQYLEIWINSIQNDSRQ